MNPACCIQLIRARNISVISAKAFYYHNVQDTRSTIFVLRYSSFGDLQPIRI